jgi:hypothetical protein
MPDGRRVLIQRIIKGQRFPLSLLAYISLRGFQRVQFESIFFDFLLDMSGEIARTFCPFYRGLAIGLAIGPYFIINHSVTPFAGLHDGITSPTVIGTACLLHEDTFCSHLDGLTNHGDLPPFSLSLFFQMH